VTFVDRTHLYTAKSGVRPGTAVAPKGKNPRVSVSGTPPQSCPEALGSPAGSVVRPGQGLLWPHPSHSSPSGGLSSSSAGHSGGEWVPNLSRVSVRACHPQYPGGPVGCPRLLLPRPHWSSSSPQRLDLHKPQARWFSPGPCNEAESGSLALRRARGLALHQPGLLLPSLRRPGRPGPTSVITT
jgi:hypothetical protein